MKGHQNQLEAKLKEILSNRSDVLTPEKSILVKTYAQLNDTLFEYKAYFILKAEKEVAQLQISPSKKKQQTKK